VAGFVPGIDREQATLFPARQHENAGRSRSRAGASFVEQIATAELFVYFLLSRQQLICCYTFSILCSGGP